MVPEKADDAGHFRDVARRRWVYALATGLALQRRFLVAFDASQMSSRRIAMKARHVARSRLFAIVLLCACARAASAQGLGGNDVPFSLRLSGAYELPSRVMVSATLQRNTGFPELTTVSIGTNTVVLTQGPQTLTVEPRGTTRLPAVNSLDMSIRRPIKASSATFEPRIDFYNLTNAATILGRA
jgi:hypothetical protein